jgi:hypothetical protein
MLSLASAVQRLPKRATSHSPDVAKALIMAKRTLSRLRRQWLAFRSWPFDAAQQDEKMEDYRRSLRELMEVVIDARCGMPIRFTHFAQNSIVAELVEHLLAGRMRETDSRKRGSVIRTLKVEIFSKFVLSGWLPTSTASQRDFQRQLGLFLKARRIDWPKVLNRGSRRTSSFRDELHEVDDDTEDEG